MPIDIKPKFISTVPDDPESAVDGMVTPSRWNDGSELTLESGMLVGRSSPGAGPAEEVDPNDLPISSAVATALGLKLTTSQLDATLAGKPNATAAIQTLVALSAAGQLYKINPMGNVNIRIQNIHFFLTGGAGNAAILNTQMAEVAAAGGGEIWLAPGNIILDATLDNKYPRVLVKGMQGNNMLYSVTKTHPTTIVPAFAGTVLRHRTPYAAETGGVPGPRNDGGGFENLRVIGNGQATLLLEVDSVASGSYHLVLDGCVGAVAARFRCGVTGTDLSEATNIQHASIQLVVRQVDVGAASLCDCVWFEGSVNSNVCFNEDIDLDLQHYDGDGLVGFSADNNIITMRARRTGGAGLPLVAKGPNAAVPVGFEGNTFHRYSANVAGYAEGTGDPGVTAGITNFILGLDNLNGTPLPTAGTGSSWPSITLAGLMREMCITPGFVIADNANTAIAERLTLGTKGLVLSNGSEGHLTLQNNASAAKWLHRIINASGNLQTLRQAGSGYIDYGAVQVRAGYLMISDGVAAPGATAGMAKLYVDTADGDGKLIFADGAIVTIPDVAGTVQTREATETLSGQKTFSLPPILPSYTVATLPSAAAHTQGLIYVSDGTGDKRLAVSNGTNWRWPDGAIVS